MPHILTLHEVYSTSFLYWPQVQDMDLVITCFLCFGVKLKDIWFLNNNSDDEDDYITIIIIIIIVIVIIIIIIFFYMFVIILSLLFFLLLLLLYLLRLKRITWIIHPSF